MSLLKILALEKCSRRDYLLSLYYYINNDMFNTYDCIVRENFFRLLLIYDLYFIEDIDMLMEKFNFTIEYKYLKILKEWIRKGKTTYQYDNYTDQKIENYDDKELEEDQYSYYVNEVIPYLEQLYIY